MIKKAILLVLIITLSVSIIGQAAFADGKSLYVELNGAKLTNLTVK